MRRPINIQTRQRGFTFIELLIGLVIMGILFMVGFANYRGFASRQNIEAVVREMKGDLRLAQQMATSGVKSSDPASSCHAIDKELQGYVVRGTSATSYAVYANCDGENLVKEVNLSEKYPNITLSDFEFTFLPLAGGITWSGPDRIDIDEVVGGASIESRQIIVTAAGQIN
ncbi:prepilin-type N-terminal cleavage/methylation domain-containing protein [Candidatus Woesebacteria bacterium]|nr:MAG: prepilin-type N-terminal cleavage/methylation domain-containing protein [Candidatus Woesebacteria bacterium]